LATLFEAIENDLSLLNSWYTSLGSSSVSVLGTFAGAGLASGPLLVACSELFFPHGKFAGDESISVRAHVK
jgi:hypothetical protein